MRPRLSNWNRDDPFFLSKSGLLFVFFFRPIVERKTSGPKSKPKWERWSPLIFFFFFKVEQEVYYSHSVVSGGFDVKSYMIKKYQISS